MIPFYGEEDTVIISDISSVNASISSSVVNSESSISINGSFSSINSLKAIDCGICWSTNNSPTINDNNKNAEAYKNATFDIFTSINSDIKNVVRPRSQIDSIMSSAPLREKGNDIKLPSLEFLDLINTANLEKILISFNQSTATITIKDMPSLQFKAIKALAKKMNIVILNEETISLDNSVSGLIEVSIDNE